ncbi:protein MULTIPLE CHLOROPLAST DIVISION SITE 1 [Rhodamnia argentea]|uniref:Protein MULTIPLE CHLOROPLAST DIVISION SITE 1 n=1 Tax=Rhodamnia argentea TaxID=178133 RepID=A0A8B8PNN6_9MYRT|nr:protein MULTIPLE CHLOROPLAST DIVISION SITE 1 [Rhodamnia argentea]
MTPSQTHLHSRHALSDMSMVWCLHIPSVSLQPCACVLKRRVFSNLRMEFGLSRENVRWNVVRSNKRVVLRAIANPMSSSEPKPDQEEVVESEKGDPLAKFHGIVTSLPPVVYVMKRKSLAGFAFGLCIVTAFVFIAVRVFAARKANYNRSGSVADLVRRGQLRSDRRGITRPLKYDDPFNNPLVKVGKRNSTLEMCGKVYRLAPVTLTKEQQAIHKKRRSRAYQWKRPTTFLKEGDMIPPDVDPDTVRWIPANHPFATTASDIDEDLAQTNVYQKHGVPFRIQAEHEELQRKLEALQMEQKLDKLVIDRKNTQDFERPLKFPASPLDGEQNASHDQSSNSSESAHSSSSPSISQPSAEEIQKQ